MQPNDQNLYRSFWPIRNLGVKLDQLFWQISDRHGKYIRAINQSWLGMLLVHKVAKKGAKWKFISDSQMYLVLSIIKCFHFSILIRKVQIILLDITHYQSMETCFQNIRTNWGGGEVLFPFISFLFCYKSPPKHVPPYTVSRRKCHAVTKTSYMSLKNLLFLSFILALSLSLPF